MHHRVTLASSAGNVIPIPERRRNRHEAPARVPLRIVRIEDWEELPELEDEWNSLLERCGGTTVFQTYQWHRSWWKAFGAGEQLLLLLCYSGTHLVGIAPMMVTRRHRRVRLAPRKICFIGSSDRSSDYCDFLIDTAFPGAVDVLLNELCKNPGRSDCLHLTNLPERSRNTAAMRRYFSRRKSLFITEVDQPAPCLVLGNSPDDKKVVNKNSLRRHYNYFRKCGDLRFHRCNSSREILHYLDRFFYQHISRRELAGTTSQFLERAHCEFYVNLVESLFPQGWLKFDVVLFNGEPLAFHFGFEYQNRFIWYKPTFDVAYARKSPGEVLIKYLLEDAIARGLAEFDFTVGCEPFKLRFANETRYNTRLIVFRSRRAYWYYHARKVLRRYRRKMSTLWRHMRPAIIR